MVTLHILLKLSGSTPKVPTLLIMKNHDDEKTIIWARTSRNNVTDFKTYNTLKPFWLSRKHIQEWNKLLEEYQKNGTNNPRV